MADAFAGPRGIAIGGPGLENSDLKWVSRSGIDAETGKCWFLRPVMKFIADHSCAGDFRYSSRRVWKYSCLPSSRVLCDRRPTSASRKLEICATRAANKVHIDEQPVGESKKRSLTSF